MTDPSPRLAPCPFCGSSDVHLDASELVHCDSCHACSPLGQDCEVRWNRFAEHARIGREVERVRSLRPMASSGPDGEPYVRWTEVKMHDRTQLRAHLEGPSDEVKRLAGVLLEYDRGGIEAVRAYVESAAFGGAAENDESGGDWWGQVLEIAGGNLHPSFEDRTIHLVLAVAYEAWLRANGSRFEIADVDTRQLLKRYRREFGGPAIPPAGSICGRETLEVQESAAETSESAAESPLHPDRVIAFRPAYGVERVEVRITDALELVERVAASDALERAWPGDRWAQSEVIRDRLLFEIRLEEHVGGKPVDLDPSALDALVLAVRDRLRERTP